MNEPELWVAAGGYELTGRREGPPGHAPGRPASAVQETLDAIARHAPGVPLPGVELLGRRALLSGLKRRGPFSCGGAFRALRTPDGWVGLSLPRPSDLEMLPALTFGDIKDPWSDVARWAGTITTAEADERIQLLGLAGGRIPLDGTGERPSRPAVVSTPLGVRRPRKDLTVVDLTSLWAGPLCAHLLGLTGAHVIKVESHDRPDGARAGSPAFFQELHAGHEMVRLDPKSDSLRRLIDGADLVLEGSRPRALAQLGIDAEAVGAAGTSWLSITARGRASNTIGFGDDVAACAGMVVLEDDAVLPVGDALADPLTGVRAAEAALEALASGEARLIDVSMLHVVTETLHS